MPKVNLFKNKFILLSVILACLVLVLTLINEKTRTTFKLLPMFRGEVALNANNFVITTTMDGSPIIINKDDPHVNNLRMCGQVHSLFNDVLKVFLKRNHRIIIEIGPRFGYNTINLAKTLTPDGKMYVFEANKEVCNALRKTITLNDLGDLIKLKNIAISDHEGLCKIPDCTSIRELSGGTFSKAQIFSAQCRTLDSEIAGEKGAVDLISIDVHDSEIQVLKACNNVIARSPNIAIVLTFDNDPVDIEARAELEAIQELGMKIYLCSKNNQWREIEDIDELLQHRNVVLVLSKNEIELL